MSRVSLLAFFAMSLALATTLPAVAQDHALLAELYGEGVHAYFAGDNQAAYASLTEAIEGGTDDPRAFYFRGLVLDRMGRPEAAVADFEAGAVVEVNDTDNYYNVNTSLQRVQGYTRLAIEDYRQQARLTLATQVREQQQQRYQRRQGAEAAVLRGTPPTPAREFEAIEPGVAADEDDDLFGDGGGISGAETDVAPARPAQGDQFDRETGSGVAGDSRDPVADPDPSRGFDTGDTDEAAPLDEPFPFDFEDEGEEAMPLDEDSMEPAPRGDAAGEEDGPGGSFGLGDILGGRTAPRPPRGDYEAGPPGMDDGELPYTDGSEELDAADDNHQAGPPGMDDPEFPYAEEGGDSQVDPFADDVPRPEMQDEFLREGDPVQPSDGRPEMGEEFEREEGGVLEDAGVPAEDAVDDGPGGEADFDELFGS